MEVPAAIDDQLWSALGDPTRRRMLDLLLADQGGTATTLSGRLPVTRQAVTKHLAVLERAGLVRTVEVGRRRRFVVDDELLGFAAGQMATVSAAWQERAGRSEQCAGSASG